MLKYLLMLLGLGYVACPLDLAPDVFVGVGWLDDLALLVFLWWWFFKRRGIGLNNLFGRTAGAGYAGAGSRASGGNGRRQDPGQQGKKDPYAVLGISSNASREEIRKAYRELANRYHPDKVNHLGEEFRDLAEERFKEVQSAYQELTK
jgi:DnaJ like chaperone protein